MTEEEIDLKLLLVMTSIKNTLHAIFVVLCVITGTLLSLSLG